MGIAEYRRFLHLHQKYPEHWVAASKLVDIVWHEHILDTKRYMADSEHLFGRYLHHYPTFRQGEPFLYEKEMLKAYKDEFGELPRQDIWPLDATADVPTRKLSKCPAPAPTPPPANSYSTPTPKQLSR